MAYTTIDDPSAHFHTQLFSGTGSSQSITNDANAGDLQPDWVWIKKRAGGTARNSILTDSTRGVTKCLSSALDDAEFTNTNGLTAFGTDGFTVGSYDSVNESSGTYVAWQWKANGGTTTSVSGTGTTAGSTKAGTYQANTTAGFSIVTFSTGSDDNGDHRIQHGLGAVPHFIITKERDGTYEWYTYHHKGTDDNDYLRLNLTDATSNAGARNVFDGSDFTSTYFEMDNNNITNDNKTYVAYCFTEIQGYSKFGSYTANNSTNGPFVYLGFKPSWVMVRNTSAAADWPITDNKREAGNPFGEEMLFANVADAETNYTGGGIDFLSNGFKIRSSGTNGVHNANNTSHTFIYMAFAESPFVSSKGVPTTAK